MESILADGVKVEAGGVYLGEGVGLSRQRDGGKERHELRVRVSPAALEHQVLRGMRQAVHTVVLRLRGQAEATADRRRLLLN